MHCYVALSNDSNYLETLLIDSLLANQGLAKKARPVEVVKGLL